MLESLHPFGRSGRLGLAGGLLLLASMPLDGASPTIEVTTESRSLQPGELVVITVATPPETTRVRVEAFDREIPSFKIEAGTWRALVGIDLDTPVGRHTVAIRAESPGQPTLTENHVLVVARRDFPTRKLTVAPAYVEPPPETLRRIQREAAEIGQMWRQSSDEPLWAGSFVRPVPGVANSSFGSRSIFNGQPRSPHSGADFRGSTGTPIKAPNGGRIVLARDLYFTGNTVAIDHGLGLISLFAHLSELGVSEGDSVSTGEVVGRVGATGRVTGPHLHWSLRANGARIDPLSLLALLGDGSAAREP